ncbi:MAG TPA: hypothetical protein VG938_12395 [Verrucomicrobiae bacterium]|nr:hypothetical protein [Verrucomicrobiae bacterium]
MPALFLLCSLCACQSLRHPQAAPQPTESGTPEKSAADLQTRDNALALLDDLLNDEKNVSKVLIIKSNSDELGRLIKNISKTAGNSAVMLESLAKSEPGLDLKKLDLPPGEATARKAISKEKEHVLLHSKDAEFEFQLLLTQVEALNYGANLALVAAENEPRASNTRELLALSAQLRDLHEQVLAMLRVKR